MRSYPSSLLNIHRISAHIFRHRIFVDLVPVIETSGLLCQMTALFISTTTIGFGGLQISSTTSNPPQPYPKGQCFIGFVEHQDKHM